MKLKCKIVIVFLFLLSFTLFFNINNVFASESYVSPPDKIIEELESKEYYNNSDYDYFVYKWGTKYSILFIKKTDTLKFYTYISNHVYIYSSEAFCGYIYTYNSSCSLISSGEVVDALWNNYNNCGYIDGNVGVSSMDIYTDITYSTVFFQAPPQKVEGVTIPALETAEQVPTAMVGTLKMIIPVGLVIFGILLLILLVKSVILRIT